MKIYLRERTWVPLSMVRKRELTKIYKVHLYNDMECKSCRNLSRRLCTECLDCEGYRGTYRLWQNKKIRGRIYVGLPRGNQGNITRILKAAYREGRHHTKDLRPEGPLLEPLPEFVGTLWDFQQNAVETLHDKGYGILHSPPRTGKTVMAVALVLRLGVKTLFLTHQRDLLDQALRTFRDPKFTDIQDIEKAEGRQIVGVAKGEDDYENFDICLATYQGFISEGGKQRLKRLRDSFPLLIIDEVHRGNAATYARTISNINARYTYGLTATPYRKDNMHFVMDAFVGPVVCKTNAKTLTPKVVFIRTPVHHFQEYALYSTALRYLSRHKERNNLIIEHAMDDIEADRCLIIVCWFVEHAHDLADQLNTEYGDRVAAAITGRVPAKKRLSLLDDARERKLRCIVITRKLVTGLDVPQWDTMYAITPDANPPNFQQELERICTPMPGKPQPLVKFFLDAFGISIGCFRISYRVMRKLGFEFDTVTMNEAQQQLAGTPGW